MGLRLAERAGDTGLADGIRTRLSLPGKAVPRAAAVATSFQADLSTKRREGAGAAWLAAIQAVHQSVGRAMVFSTLALVVGFAVLCSSQFVPTIYFGVLVTLTMLGGLAGNLVVLPLLLRLAARDRPGLADSGQE